MTQYTSNIPGPDHLFFAAGSKPLILGPGSQETAHTPNGQRALNELTAAARIYAALCLEAGINTRKPSGYA